MGVPFEALLPYGAIIGVRLPRDPREEQFTDAQVPSSSWLPAEAYQTKGICRMEGSGRVIPSIIGTKYASRYGLLPLCERLALIIHIAKYGSLQLLPTCCAKIC